MRMTERETERDEREVIANDWMSQCLYVTHQNETMKRVETCFRF